MKARYALAGALVLSCGDARAPSRVDPLSQATVTNGFPAVGMLELSHGALCTGTLVGEGTVLTAAHCAEEGARFTLGAETHTVVHALKHPLAQLPALSDNDLALLTLDGPSTVVPLRVATSAPQEGAAVTLVGFGQNESGENGKKRTASTQVAHVEGPRFVLREPGPTACAGDSGGPAFDAEGKIVGVIALGNPGCGGESRLVNAPVYASWVAKVLGTPGGDAAPEVSIVRPGEGAQMPVTFTLSANAQDDFGIVHAQWSVDGAPVASAAPRSSTLAYAATLSPGAHTVSVTVEDALAQAASATVRLTIVAPKVEPGARGSACWDDSDCDGAKCLPSGTAKTCGGITVCAVSPGHWLAGLLLLALTRRKRA